MPEQADANYLTLTQAAKVAPGRPSTNCLWRWCRRGVLARDGTRVRLEHVRLGGRVYTTPGWLAQFGRHLATADRAYFDGRIAAAGQLPPRDPRYGPPKRPGRVRQSSPPPRRVDLDAIHRELESEGL